MAKRRDPSTVLKYTSGDRVSVHLAYLRWREEKGIPLRCDNAQCQFHNGELLWNSKPLKPTLDHKNGVNTDNRPENLQFLCPNCDSQLHTKGGGNKGRVQKLDRGWSVKDKDNRVSTGVVLQGVEASG